MSNLDLKIKLFIRYYCDLIRTEVMTTTAALRLPKLVSASNAMLETL